MMASEIKTLYEKDGVYIHINVNTHTSDRDAHLPGRIYLLQKEEGTFIEWKAEEVMSLDNHSEQDWAMISSVGYQPDRGSDTVADQKAERKRYNVSFDVLDLKSFKRSAPSHGWAYIIFILKDGTTYPAVHFHNGGSKALLKELEKFIHIRRSPQDSRLFIIQDHDPEALSMSFDELNLFQDSQGDLVTKFIKDPYTTTLGGFSKVTNFLKDVLMQPEVENLPPSKVEEILNEDIPGMEINNQDEPGYELVSKTKLPSRQEVKRGLPLTSQQWSKHMDKEGRIINVEEVKDQIFRGGVESSLRIDVWKFLLGVYEWDSTYSSRTKTRKRKLDDYFRMKLQWTTIRSDQEKRFSLFKERKCLIEKDVTRTDRTHKFFEGEGNPNLQVLHDILMTYCMYNFDLGYVQGMSDLLSPILVVMENEVDAFWCFAGYMERVCDNFQMDQEGMKTQLAQIHKLMQYTDPELCNYLESHDSGNFYFCFRWILIHFKREFSFSDAQRLWEVIWTDKPCKNFHLIICLSILDTEKTTLMENKFGLTEILKHINDMSMAIHLEETLKKAEGIFLQLKNAKHLPDGVKEILGFPTASLSSSPAGSRGSSGTSTPVIPHTPANTPVNVPVNVPVNATLTTVSYSKENSARLQLPEFLRENGNKSNSGNASPDDSSIEILSDNCNSATSNFYN
ncbi:TBC1 domain family member 15-like isoform X2 [Mercenaria mercenaria]|uniref:TBC1 domain family member 15-like isoform X2 n=1 Tax=Mercenaria mercenaria TaxID=6596 RepID=UPI001E1D3C85|nr:TBC1 domain family member 15-like isoform X2 [Mercenaria mercenaria]